MELSNEDLQRAMAFSSWAHLFQGIGWSMLFIASTRGALRWRHPGLMLMALGFGFFTLRFLANLLRWLLGAELPQGLLSRWMVWDMYLSAADAFFALMAGAGLLWPVFDRKTPNQDSSRSR